MDHVQKPRSFKVVLLVVSAVFVIWGWNGAKNNPRDGWSMIKVSLHLAPASSSGDQAWLAAGNSSFAEIKLNNPTLGINGVMVLVRRDRRGIFIPWLETWDLRVITVPGHGQPWHSGMDDPRWIPLLKQARDSYAAHDTEWHQRIATGIDTELAGGYPDRNIRPWYLLLEIFVLLAHGMLFVAAIASLHRLTKAHIESKHLNHLRTNLNS